MENYSTAYKMMRHAAALWRIGTPDAKLTALDAVRRAAAEAKPCRGHVACHDRYYT